MRASTIHTDTTYIDPFDGYHLRGWYIHYRYTYCTYDHQVILRVWFIHVTCMSIFVKYSHGA